MGLAQTSSDPRLGQVIDNRYRIRELVGVGGMGVVYLAERERIGRPVAVKFLAAEAAGDPRFLRRFEVEARVLGKLEHPHCVSVMDFGVADVPYIVMQYVSGPTLRDELAKGPVPVDRALAIARQLLAGLAHAHDRGIIHRDIKPSNIKLEEVTGTGHHVRILDFGLAKLRDPLTWLPPSNPFITVGTPSYMSPEQFAGKKIDIRTDIYSTGALLFELLTGRKPFEFHQPREGFRMHTEWPRPRLRQVAPSGNFSAELEKVVLRAMAQSRDDRFQTAIEFCNALGKTPEAGAVATPAVDATMRVEKAPPARRAPIGLVVLGLVAAAAVVLAVVRPGAPETPPEVAPAPAVVAEPAVAEEPEPVVEQEDPAELVRRADEQFARSRWSRALRLYRRAIQLDPSLRERAAIHENAIRALRGKRSHRRAAQLIERELGVEAIPYLERATRHSESNRVRRRAGRLLTKLRERKR